MSFPARAPAWTASEKPASDAAVYIDRERFYFPTLPSDLFKKVNYDGETEWAFYYADGEHDDYIFATLPNLGGSLTVTSGFEGLGTELHLDLRGGVIKINSQDDGINVNEDHVSTVIISGADVTINAGLGAEGDGSDSNGYIRLDGGRLSVNGVRVPDSALDSEDGITYFGGEIYVDGVF